jgi:hypothetical protein
MKILKTWIDWYLGWANNPVLNIQLDSEYPTEFLYEKKDGIYYAENEFICSFFAYTSPGDGYGGQKFHLNMKDGTKETLIGPWSSNHDYVNSVGFGPCINCSIWTPKFKNCSVAGNIRIDKAEELLKDLDIRYRKWFHGFKSTIKLMNKDARVFISGKDEIEERFKASALIEYNKKATELLPSVNL